MEDRIYELENQLNRLNEEIRQIEGLTLSILLDNEDVIESTEKLYRDRDNVQNEYLELMSVGTIPTIAECF